MNLASTTRKIEALHASNKIKKKRTAKAAAAWNKAHPEWIDNDKLPTTTKQSLDMFWRGERDSAVA